MHRRLMGTLHTGPAALLQAMYCESSLAGGVHLKLILTGIYGRIVGKVWVQPSDCPTCPIVDPRCRAGATQRRVWLGGIGSMRKDRAAEKTAAAVCSSRKQEARVRRVGLWGDADPVPPWEWRRR